MQNCHTAIHQTKTVLDQSRHTNAVELVPNDVGIQDLIENRNYHFAHWRSPAGLDQVDRHDTILPYCLLVPKKRDTKLAWWGSVNPSFQSLFQN